MNECLIPEQLQHGIVEYSFGKKGSVNITTLAKHDDCLKSGKKLKKLSQKKSNPREKCRVYRILHPKLQKMDECLSKSNADSGDKNYDISAALYVAIVKFSKQFFRLYRSSDSEVIYKKGVPRNFAKFTGKNLCQSPFFNKAASLIPAPATLSK